MLVDLPVVAQGDRRGRREVREDEPVEAAGNADVCPGKDVEHLGRGTRVSELEVSSARPHGRNELLG